MHLHTGPFLSRQSPKRLQCRITGFILTLIAGVGGGAAGGIRFLV